MNNLKKREQYIQEELKPWSDHDSSLSKEKSGNFSIKGFKGNSYNDGFDDPDNERAKKFRDRYQKHMDGSKQSFSKEDLKKAFNDGKEYGYMVENGYFTTFETWFDENYGSKIEGETDENGWIDQAGMGMSANIEIRPEDGMHENMLPKPYKKVKCAECGEEVCDNINYKIGHL